jgi:hypothetical protein
VDLVDDTFVVARPEVLADRIGAAGAARTWWPDLELSLTRDRGVKGRHWAVRGVLVGTAEVWLEPYADGAVVHLFLRADLRDGARLRPRARSRALARERTRRTLAWKRYVHALKDELEAGRAPGCPAPFR